MRLNGKRYPADTLRPFLVRPQTEPFRPPQWQMPDLKLQEREIAALIAFINGEAPTAEQ